MRLEGGIPSELGGAKKLKVLNMSKWSSDWIVREGMIVIEHLTDMFVHVMWCLFVIAGNNITGKIPSEIGECESLNDFDIGKITEPICTIHIIWDVM